MMGAFQRVEQETVSSQCLANAIENMSRTRIDATGNRLQLKTNNKSIQKASQAAHHWQGSRVKSLNGWDMSFHTARGK